MQFGVCLTYLIFVPQNLHEAVRGLFGWEVEKTVLLIIMVLIQIPLAWIRDIRKLTPFNVLATFLIAYGLASCLAIAFWEITKDPSSTFLDRLMSLSPTNNDTWFLFIGTAVSCFCYLNMNGRFLFDLMPCDCSFLRSRGALRSSCHYKKQYFWKKTRNAFLL